VTKTETRIFHYDLLGHLIAETNQSGQMLAEYVYLGDQLLAMIKPGELAYYFHNDHLGTPQVLTNEIQTVAWKAVHTPFGQAMVSIETVENPFRFPGQYYDQETGLHYNYFRYYNPQTGRYITPDPIGLEGGINLFAYVQNNPVNRVDPLGLWYIDIGFNIPIFGPFGGFSFDIRMGPCGNMLVPGLYIGTPGFSVMGATGNPTAGFQQSISGGYWIGGMGTSYGQHGPYSVGGGFSTPGSFAVEIFQYGFYPSWLPGNKSPGDCKCKK
jgi:RHS repeat-associated protein